MTNLEKPKAKDVDAPFMGRRGKAASMNSIRLRSLFLAPLTKDFQDISLALKASEGQDGDEASNIFVKLVKDMSVMQFDDRASFRVVARSVDGDGEGRSEVDASDARHAPARPPTPRTPTTPSP